MSQTDLAKIVGCSRETISKYEKDGVMPSIEIADKIADAFEVSLDFLVGKSVSASFDKKMIQRMTNIDKLPNEEKNSIMIVIDAFLRDYNAKQAYK